jgi:DNA-directed RNA polymerase specialized sigma24 family protein
MSIYPNMEKVVFNVSKEQGIIEALETSLDIEKAFTFLPPRQAAILAMRMDNFTRQAIKNLLGVSRTTIWNDERLALQTLRDVLSGPEIVVKEEDLGIYGRN